jgi:hypothetical protein
MPARVPSHPLLQALGTSYHGIYISLPPYLTLGSPRHRVVSVLSTCTVGIASASTRPTVSRLHSVGGISFLTFPGCSNQMTSARCLSSFIPILSPKICQGPDSSDAHGHVSRDRCILRQGDIQD